MTPIDYKALAERIEAHAECHANVEPFDDEQRQWADDLRTVVSLLGGMADEKPALWMQSNHVSWAGKQPFMARCAPTQLQPDFVPLHLHPAPQPQPTEAQRNQPVMTQYAKRDPMALDLAGNYYSRHVSAMTAEGLHAKSDIAAELAYRDALLADRDEREAALRAEVERLKAAIDMQPSPPTREDTEWAGKVHLAEAEKENDALRAEVEALRALLRRAGDALVCGDDLMREGDAWQESHACGRCDDYVDRGWPIRTEIRAALAAKD